MKRVPTWNTRVFIAAWTQNSFEGFLEIHRATVDFLSCFLTSETCLSTIGLECTKSQYVIWSCELLQKHASSAEWQALFRSVNSIQGLWKHTKWTYSRWHYCHQSNFLDMEKFIVDMLKYKNGSHWYHW